jgi:hypothetical protein
LFLQGGQAGMTMEMRLILWPPDECTQHHICGRE